MQQVNLYLDEFKHIEPAYSAKTSLFLAVYSVLLGLLVSIILIFIMWWWQSTLTESNKQLKIWQENLDIAQIEFPEPAVDAHFKKNIDLLKAEISRNKLVLKYLESRQLEVEQQSFSILLLALTWVNEKDLWLTDIKITSGGTQLYLSGKALNANNLPSYLNKLSEIEVFSQMKFRVFEMNREGDKFNFVVSSQRGGEAIEQVLEKFTGQH